MNQERWRQAKEIFVRAVDLPSEEVGEFLRSACGSDAELRREVENLLATYDSGFLENPELREENRDAPRFLVGSRLGRYEVDSLVGSGGMGEVYVARDAALDRLVCLKVISPEAAADRVRLDRFVREARAASALNHPNICTVYEIDAECDPPYIAMEYVDGETLSQTIRHGKMDPPSTIEIAVQIAEGLSDAHAAGIVHRDIKPANIIVTKRGRVKIVDFGLAKRFVPPGGDGRTMAALTQSGTIVGTVSYMSPEQARGRAVDARTDVWSLGVVLYEMLTGRLPFTGESTGDVIASILRSEPDFLSKFSNFPSDLERILRTALSKDSAARYPSAREFAEELRNASTTRFDRRPFYSETTAVMDAPRPLATVAAGSPGYDLFIRGRVKACSENRDEVEEAIDLLEKAIDLDPGHAGAFAALARAYTTKAFQFASEAEKQKLHDDAEVAVEKALALDPDLAEGHFARGVILWTLAKRFPHEHAIECYRRAIQLDPNLDEAHHRLGLVYFHVGLLDAARDEVAKALKINPNNTMARFRMGTIDAHQGKYEDALEIFKTIPRDVSPAIVDRATADTLVHLGRLEEAEALVEDYLERYPHDEGGNVTSVKAVILAKRGEREAAKEMIRRAIKIGRGFGHFHHTECNIASTYAVLGEPREAVRWLRDAAETGFPCYTYFTIDGNLDNIRTSPEFIEFMTELRRAYEKRMAAFLSIDPGSDVPVPADPFGKPATAVSNRRRPARTAVDKETAIMKTITADIPHTTVESERRVAPSYRRPIILVPLALLVAAAISVGWFMWRPEATVQPQIKTLAVLPLKSLDAGENYLGFGIADAVIRRISQTGELTVRPTSAVRRYMAEETDALTAARELAADAVLEGTIQRAGERLRVTVNLLRAGDGTSLWTENFNTQLTDIFAVQDKVAQQVADRLQLQLDPVQQARLAKRTTSDPVAYEFYVKGVYAFNQRRFDDEARKQIDSSIELLQKAIEKDPAYALAHAKLANAYAWKGLFIDVDNQPRLLALAEDEINKADTLDPQLAETHVSRFRIMFSQSGGWRIEEAAKEILTAQQADPTLGHEELADLYLHLGLEDLMDREIRKALEIDPTSEWVKLQMLTFYILLNRYDDYLKVKNDYFPEQPVQAGFYLVKGDLAKAREVLDEEEKKDPRGADPTLRSMLLALEGRRRESEALVPAILKEAKRLNPAYHHVAYDVACIFAMNGNLPQAMKWLNEAASTGNPSYTLFTRDPFLDKIRQTPEFMQFMAELKPRYDRYRSEFR